MPAAGWDSTSTIRLWDVATGEQVRLIDENTGVVLSVTYSPDGVTLASGSQDGAIRLWDAATGARKRTLRGHSSNITSLAFSPDSLKLASGSRDRTVRLWDANRDVLVRTLKGHTSLDRERLLQSGWKRRWQAELEMMILSGCGIRLRAIC